MTRNTPFIVGVLLVALIAALFAVPTAGVQAQGDDRVNCHEASPIVIYCSADGIDIYSTGGLLLLHVSSDVIDAVGVPDVNTLLAQTFAGGVRVYRLSTGEYQVNTVNGAQEYVAIWEGCQTASADLKVYSTWNWELLSDDDGCTFVGGLPDLIVASITQPQFTSAPDAFGLQALGFSIVVTNQGDVDSGPFHTSLLIDWCEGTTTEDLGMVGNLAPGSSHTYSWMAEIWPCSLTATADSQGQVGESIETNNTRTLSLPR